MIITQTPFRMSFFGGGTDMESFFRENGKPKDAPTESDAEPQTKKGRLSFEDEKGGI